MTSRSSSWAGDRVAWVILACALVMVASIWLRHATHYFFLFDDFALVGGSAQRPAADLLTSAMFGFYRPLLLLSLRAESAWFGWSLPAGYAYVSLALHAGNGLLVYLLARRSGLQPLPSAAGGALMFTSAWGAEAVFWVSARSDVLASTFTLGVLLAGSHVLQATTRRGIAAWSVIGLAAAAGALAAKEMAVTLPVVVFVYFGWAHAPRRLRAGVGFGLAVGIVLAGYLAVREQILPGLGGPYGGAEVLFRIPTANIVGFVRQGLLGPLPVAEPARSLSLALLVPPVLAVILPAALWVTLREAPSRTLALLVAFCISVVPVLWAGPASRFLYVPGIWLSLWWASGLDAVRSRLEARARGGFSFVLLIIVAYFTASLAAQAAVWRDAALLARSSTEQFGGMVDRGIRAVYIPNLPHYCAEGPFIMKAYAFGFYYAGHQVPSVRAQATVPRCSAPGFPVAAALPDPFSGHQQPVPDEVEFRLQPPVPSVDR